MPNSALLRATGYWCGKVSNKWIPGKLLSGGYFYSHDSERTNILAQAKKASKAKKKALLKEANLLKGYITPRTSNCANLLRKPLRFNLSTASGVVLKPPTSTVTSGISKRDATSSNLQTVNEDGSLSSALTSGSATFDRILVAPGNRLFVVFKSKTNILDTMDTTNGCWLAEVSRATGIPTCIESEFSPSWFPGDVSYHNPSIQFDQDGNPYYFGQSIVGTGPSAVVHVVVRKVVNGQKINVVDLPNSATQRAYATDFLVLPDGSVIYAGTDLVAFTLFTRRVTPSGNSADLWPYTAQFISRFADGNIYAGRNHYFSAVQRYLVASDSVDPRSWIRHAPPEESDQPYLNTYPDCDSNNDRCVGGIIRGLVNTDSGKTFVSAGVAFESSPSNPLAQVYPTLSFPITSIKKVIHMQKYGNKIILMGTDVNSNHTMTLYDTDDNSELSMISASDNIEVFNAQHSSTGNTIIFHGQRKSDSRYVTGAFDLDTANLSVNVVGNTALFDLAAFQ